MMQTAKKVAIQFAVSALCFYALGKVAPAVKEKVLDPTGKL